MTRPSPSLNQESVPAFLSGGGEAGALALAFDWSQTSVGPIAAWPASLKTTVGTLLHSRHPMFLWWGPDLIQFYNDAYIPSFGEGKHPAAMGQPGAACWQEIWPIIWPQIDDVMSRGQASWNEDHLVPILRNGRIEEVYWTYGYSPVFDDDGRIGGTLVVCTETTSRVIATRRVESLRALAERTSFATDSSLVIEQAADVLSATVNDVAFAHFYQCNADSGTTQLVHTVGIDQEAGATVDAHFRERLLWLADRGEPAPMPAQLSVTGGPLKQRVSTVFVARIGEASPTCTSYVLFALSPALVFDRAYRDFLLHFAGQVAQAQTQVAARKALERGQAEREGLFDELEAASRAKDEFLAMLGHELRNPLSPILTALQLMRLRGVRGADREREIIERQVKHVVGLVDDLLDVSRITRGAIELKRDQIQLAEVVARAIEQASPLIEERRHRLRVEVPSDLDVFADSGRLSQVVANLLTNAAKYTEPGGEIEVYAERRDDHVWLCVRDNGVGVNPAMMPFVFDAFAQERQQSDRSRGGLGLGLAIVKSLVEAHGGTVTLHSDGHGRGTECIVCLPLAHIETQTAHPIWRAQTSSPPSRGCRVLLVDDNEDAAVMLGAALRTLGHQVEVAFDAPSALDLAARYVPDVALLDLGLPVIDGYELASRLRIQMGWSRVRLAALTGYGQQTDRARTRAAGFDVHLVKPMDLKEVDATLRQLCSGKG